jgi:SAM-dependent methyltransferase
MSESLEKILRQLMTSAGHLVEKAIGGAHKAKVSVGTRGGLQPILSLESQFSVGRIQEMIAFATERIYGPTIPNLSGQAALEIGEGPMGFLPQFLNQQARIAVGMEIGTALTPKQGDQRRGFIIRGAASNIPFTNNLFDYVAARLATSHQGDTMRAMKEIARVLAPGGQGVLIDFHPFGLYAKKGTDRLKAVESTIRSIEDYYKVCKSIGLRIIDLRESFIDESFRNMFDSTDMQSYRNVKGTPLIIFIYFFKPRPKQP